VGPKAGDEPPAVGQRHPVLSGFDESDMLPFGGELEPLRLDAGVTVPLTFIPPFPGFLPKSHGCASRRRTFLAWCCGTKAQRGLRTFRLRSTAAIGKDHLPDHATLLANTVRWVRGTRKFSIYKGPGYSIAPSIRNEIA